MALHATGVFFDRGTLLPGIRGKAVEPGIIDCPLSFGETGPDSKRGLRLQPPCGEENARGREFY